MTTQTEALKLALDALEDFDSLHGDKTQKAITAIKKALAQPKTVNQFHPDYANEAINEMTLTIQKQAKRIEELEQEASGQYMTGYEVARSEFQQRIQELEAQVAQPEQSSLNPLWLATHPDKLAQPAVAEQHKQEPVAWANPNDLQNFDMKVRTNGGPLHTVPLYTTPPQRKQLTDAMVSAAARVLNNRQAEACGVDKDDQWKVYGEDFIEDARAMLTAVYGIKE